MLTEILPLFAGLLAGVIVAFAQGKMSRRRDTEVQAELRAAGKEILEAVAEEAKKTAVDTRPQLPADAPERRRATESIENDIAAGYDQLGKQHTTLISLLDDEKRDLQKWRSELDSLQERLEKWETALNQREADTAEKAAATERELTVARASSQNAAKLLANVQEFVAMPRDLSAGPSTAKVAELARAQAQTAKARADAVAHATVSDEDVQVD